jgi:hypothetical protein
MHVVSVMIVTISIKMRLILRNGGYLVVGFEIDYRTSSE